MKTQKRIAFAALAAGLALVLTAVISHALAPRPPLAFTPQYARFETRAGR